MILKRLRNLWRLSKYVPIDRTIEIGDQLLKLEVRPSKKAKIIKRTNEIDEFLKS